MRISTRRLLFVLLLVAVAAGLGWTVWPQPLLVETATVSRGVCTATVEEDGRTRVRERYVVAAPLAGRLSRIPRKAGDAVEAGDVIATIVPSPSPFLDPRSRTQAAEQIGSLEAALESAGAAVESAAAQARRATTQFEHSRALVADGAASRETFENDELAARVAERELQVAVQRRHAAEHELAQARALLARFDVEPGHAAQAWMVSSPVRGVVLAVMQESETIVQPGMALAEVGDPHDLEVVADVLSTDAVRIAPGAHVTLSNWGGEADLAGRVRSIEPAAFTKVSTLGVEEQRVNVLIDILSPQDEWVRLGDAFRVDVTIAVSQLADAIVVPAGAVIRQVDQWAAFVVQEGRATLRAVTVRQRCGGLVAVQSGVAPGETVIVYPTDRIEDGVAVRVQ